MIVATPLAASAAPTEAFDPMLLVEAPEGRADAFGVGIPPEMPDPGDQAALASP